jgi:hypothetical protein
MNLIPERLPPRPEDLQTCTDALRRRLETVRPSNDRETLQDALTNFACRQLPCNLIHETLVFLRDVPSIAPAGPGGRKTHLSTVMRWKDRGVRGVRLEAIRWGYRWVTSLEALARFLVNVSLGSAAPPSNPRSTSARRRHISQADSHLDQAGI